MQRLDQNLYVNKIKTLPTSAHVISCLLKPGSFNNDDALWLK